MKSGSGLLDDSAGNAVIADNADTAGNERELKTS
jgi:hypothetical protein